MNGARTAEARAHPSLALVKYWGKQTTGTNLPATTSVAVTLSNLETRTVTTYDPTISNDLVYVEDERQSADRFAGLFTALREWIIDRGGESGGFEVRSQNSFPTAAGLASSASGIAALVVSAVRAAIPGIDLDNGDIRRELSAIARIGSGSASRSVYGGFTRWEAGADYAEPLGTKDWWPDFRVVVVPVSTDKKPLSSREAMNRTRAESPFYSAWVDDAPAQAHAAEQAIAARDIELLGPTIRLSYMRMFATMLAAAPPILFWHPDTVALIHRLDKLRRDGVPAFETIDAGPQIKVVTTREHVAAVLETVGELSKTPPVVCSPGAAAA